jgi:hypothetical protein
MTANIDSKTGIAYGYISASSLDSDIVEELLFGPQAEPFSEADAEELEVQGCFENVRYVTSWLGGALNFFILESPHITHKAGKASPCVPNAAILDTLAGSITGYDVPNNWRRRED